LKAVAKIILLGLVIGFPLVGVSPYLLHVATLIFIWAFIATGWSYMGRFGLVSLGHGAFIGIGAYTAGLLFNHFSLSPWAGMIVGGILAGVMALVIGWACFRFGVMGDYFALLTLALGEIVSLVLVAFRDYTGGSLGFTLKRVGSSWFYLQFEDKAYFYYIALSFLLAALFLWRCIDRSRMQKALRAIGEDEIAAATLGVRIVKYKLRVTTMSAFVAAIGGVLYAQYVTYLNPHTLAGVGPSLDIAFKAILGGMYSLWGPTVGTTIIVVLEEYIRVNYGAKYVGISQIAYGVALVLLIIFMPKGIFGTMEEKIRRVLSGRSRSRDPGQKH
jgi:branched-chain amino acid transport system permease protein